MTLSGIGRKIILGLGNTLNKDEGLGVYAMKTLELYFQLSTGLISPEVEFLDGGVLGLNLLPWVEESSHLLVLDAVNAHKEPGTLIELKRDEIPLYTGIKLSDHQVTFQEVLALAQFRGNLPQKLHLIGIQPADISTGVDLSPLVAKTIPQVVEHAITILKEWNLIRASIKKIAFPTDDGQTISPHLGRAQFFLVTTLDNSGEIHFEKTREATSQRGRRTRRA